LRKRTVVHGRFSIDSALDGPLVAFAGSKPIFKELQMLECLTQGRHVVLGAVVALCLTAAQSAQAQTNPYAWDDEASCARNDYAFIGVLDNDSAMAQEESLVPSSVQIVDAPQSGSCMVDTQTGEVYYVPNADFFGYDTFSYKVQSTNGTWSNLAWVVVEVWFNNQAPEIRDFTAVPLGGGSWNITGRLVDDEPVADRTITLRIEFSTVTTVTATTDAEGYFSHLIVEEPSEWGFVYAKAVDSWGVESTEEIAYCSGG
jgi:hypothetical protein